MLLLIITIVLFCLATLCTTQWIQSNVTMPRPDCSQSPAIYNQSIYLLGGQKNRKQLIEYLIQNNTFIDHGIDWGSEVQSYGQSWTQLDHILYVLDYTLNTISTFDLTTTTYTPQHTTDIPTMTHVYACIASTPTQLFVLGGAYIAAKKTQIANVQIYDLVNSDWQTDAPDMLRNRSDFACIAHPETNSLYAIGGNSESGELESVEMIAINDITQNNWIYIESLSAAFAFVRCVIYRNTIYVIGGAYFDDTTQIWHTTTKVHTINVLTNEVAIFPYMLPVGLSDVAPIIVENVLYVFGGWRGATDTVVKTWTKFVISTASPTVEPTVEPTTNPTTMFPTNPPTNDPTVAPSNNPTITPTNNPTIAPTNNPTIAPTNNPTIAPTNNPTIGPSNNPAMTSSLATTDIISELNCDTECSDDALNWMQIKVLFSFAEYVTYDLTDIECFIHNVFVEWLDAYGVIRSFEPCDVHIIYVNGGTENELLCEHPPCIHSTATQKRRLLQLDGNTTMTVITKHADVTAALETVSLESGEESFAAQYLHYFALSIGVHIAVEQQNQINGPLSGIHTIWYFVVGLAILICCIGCFVMYRFIQNIGPKEDTKEPSIDDDANYDNTTANYNDGDTNVTKKMSVSTTVDYGGGEELHKLTEQNPEAGQPVIKRQNSDSCSLELMTVNQIHRSMKPQSEWTANEDNDAFKTKAQPALNMIVDGRTANEYPDLPQNMHNNMNDVRSYNDYNAFASSQVDQQSAFVTVPWSAPAPHNNAFPQGSTAIFPPQQDPNNAFSHPNQAAPDMMPNNNAFSHPNQRAPDMMANNAFSHPNQAAPAMMNDNLYSDNPYAQYLPRDHNTAGFYESQYNTSGNYAIPMEQKQQNVQAGDEEDSDTETDTEDDEEDVNTALVSNTAQVATAPAHKGTVEESAITTGSSWNTTHEESSTVTTLKTTYDPFMSEKRWDKSYRKKTVSKRKKKKRRQEDEEQVIDDKLQKMIASPSPIGTDDGMEVEDGDVRILEDASQLLEFQQVDNEDTEPESQQKPDPHNSTVLIHGANSPHANIIED